MTLNIDIHTDGACSGNPGPMGIGAVLINKSSPSPHAKRELSESVGDGTNNRAEFLAIIKALRSLKRPEISEVRIHTDSQLVIEIMSQGWKAKANLDLVQQLRDECSKVKKVIFVKVKGHSGDEHNERCNVLAQQATKNKI